jgi:biopolymer transport protein TolQ
MEYSIIKLVLGASPVVKVVIAILLFFSVVSWAIIIYKWRYLSKARKENEYFLHQFRKARQTGPLLQQCRRLKTSPMASLFKSVAGAQGTDRAELRRLLHRYLSLEEVKLIRYLNFLATTGSTTPFIGLFGTVWGIMNAFRGIGAAGSAALVVVAPGIAEALVTTAFGLAAAIPAVIGYNYFLSMARRMTVEMEDFAEELFEFFTMKAQPEATSTLLGGPKK